jgi:hypothetical protein
LNSRASSKSTATRDGKSLPAKTVPIGRVYYVVPAGDDAAFGSSTQPWKTIQKAADTLRAGETAYVWRNNG